MTLLPTTLKEAKLRGWDRLDIILVTGDAYVDHPSFGAALVGRFLESLGVRVGIIAAPSISSNDDFTCLGTPEWFFGVTAGNLDSMLMYSTASKKRRRDDAYIPLEKEGRRPKRAVIAYCNKLREIFNKPQILIGGIEASLRRFAHYDYWDDEVRRSILLDSRADLLVYGMAEQPLKKIVSALRRGDRLKSLRNIPGTAVILSEAEGDKMGEAAQRIPSYEETKVRKDSYREASCAIHSNQNPYTAVTLLQKYATRYLAVFPPSLPLTEKEMDTTYDLPFSRLPHSSYKGKIPAYDMIRFSVTAMRGCFGGCAFCSLSVHQGRIIQSRSIQSIVKEVTTITAMKGFSGFISDIGGPTANMYGQGCGKKEKGRKCHKSSCLYPAICHSLITDHTRQIELLRRVRSLAKVKKVFIASGIRFDLANCSPNYIKEIACYHVSGQLKVAPEHCSPAVLKIMKKPSIEEYERFAKQFMQESKKAGLKQFLVPYFISAHPGCGIEEQIDLFHYLRKNNLRPRQAQEFTPLPLTIAADIYYTERSLFSGKQVFVEKIEKKRAFQKALIHYYKSENAQLVRNAENRLKQKK